MNRLLLILLGLLAIGALTFLCANHHRPEIETDLTNRTAAALSGVVPGTGVTAEGQIITLNGVVLTEAIRIKAGADAANIYGVSEVRNLLTVAAPSAPVIPVMTPEVRKTAQTCQAEFSSFLQREQIQFKSASAEISSVSRRLLDTLGASAAKCPSVRFEVAGNTDSKGALDMNMKLSQSRAEAVATYLASKGVAADRMTATGYGPNAPLATNESAAGRQRNRRTEFKVKGL